MTVPVSGHRGAEWSHDICIYVCVSVVPSRKQMLYKYCHSCLTVLRNAYSTFDVRATGLGHVDSRA